MESDRRSKSMRRWIPLLAAATCAAVFLAPASAGGSQTTWVRTFDGGGSDATAGVGADPGGGVVVVMNLATGGIRVSRYSREGTLSWAFPLPGVTIPLDRYFFNSNPVFFPNGDVLIVGQATSGTTPDIYVGRVQYATGTIVWDNTYDLGGDEDPRGGQVDGSGNIVVVGQTILPGPDRDIFALKIDASSRQVLWTKFYSGSAASQPTDDRVASGSSAVLAANGDVVVSGYQFNDSSNGDDLVVKRYASADGADLGGDVVDLGDNDKAYAAAVTADNQIIVVGRSQQPGLPYEAAVLKYASLSPLDRRISLDNVDGLDAAAVFVLPEGSDNVLVGIEASTATDSEVVFRKLSAADLSPVWTYRYDVPGAGDSLKGMAFDSTGRLIALVQTANDNIGVLKIDRQGVLVDNVFLALPGIIGVSVSPSDTHVFTGFNLSNGTDQDAAIALTGPPPPPAPTGSSVGGTCFIATAAWGSPMEGEVRILRRFRDTFLLDHSMGRGLVGFYYRRSPAMARVIEGNAILRGAARFLLVPVVMGVSIAIAPYPIPAVALGFFLCAILVVLSLPSWKRPCFFGR
jgi:hypothetical protein